jgi:hypothetical protein
VLAGGGGGQGNRAARADLRVPKDLAFLRCGWGGGDRPGAGPGQTGHRQVDGQVRQRRQLRARQQRGTVAAKPPRRQGGRHARQPAAGEPVAAGVDLECGGQRLRAAAQPPPPPGVVDRAGGGDAVAHPHLPAQPLGLSRHRAGIGRTGRL